MNLPQQARTLTLPEAARRTLEAAVASFVESPPWRLAAGVEQLLLEALPVDLRAACPEMIQHWGTVAEGTARWSVRVLHRWPQPEELSVLIAYRCGSSYPDYSQFYDERLAVLSFEPGAARLRLVALADDCDNCSDLYHLDYSKSFPFGDARLVELKVTNSSDNPCCDGITQWREERLFFLLPEGEPALSLLRASEHYYHDDVEGDSEEVCDTTVGYTYDAAGRLAEITARTACREDSKAKPVETRHFHWNPARRRFEEIPAAKP